MPIAVRTESGFCRRNKESRNFPAITVQSLPLRAKVLGEIRLRSNLQTRFWRDRRGFFDPCPPDITLFVLRTIELKQPPHADVNNHAGDEKRYRGPNDETKTDVSVLVLTHMTLCGAALGSCRGTSGIAASWRAYAASQMPPI